MPWEIFWTLLLQLFIALILLTYPVKLFVAHIARGITGASLRVVVEAARLLAQEAKK